jgi:hypothetical protein
MAPVASKKATDTTSKNGSSSVKEDKVLDEKVTAACNSGSISEIVAVLDILELKQSEYDRGGGGDNIPRQLKLRLWNHQAILRFQLLKVAQDIITDKEQELDVHLLQLSTYNFDMLLSLPTTLGNIHEKESSELYCRLSYLACQIGFRFQKRKMYMESLIWCDRAIIAHDTWKSAGSKQVDVKVCENLLIHLIFVIKL